MNDDIARARLSEVPASVRDAMLADRTTLEAGGIAAVVRFFKVLDERGEHASAPSRSTFQTACKNESALAQLLRVLHRYAPSVCLSEGRDLRQDFYRARPNASNAPRAVRPRRLRSGTEPRNWPQSWLTLLPGLRAAAVKDSSINRHIASINRCADMLERLSCPPRLGWLLAWEIACEVLKGDGSGKVGVNERTVSNYVGALVSLGLHGGLDKAAVDGMRSVREHFARKGRKLPKCKQGRVNELYEHGGYAKILNVILQKLVEADGLPDWTAEAATARATAAILAICVNEPARTGDVASWKLGEELVRDAWGTWQLNWRQEKTGAWKYNGALWPEVGQVIDEHILGGRPKRHMQRRYEELRGRNWLSFSDQPYASRWPSEKVSDAIGVPLHDLRTLAADYLRLHDPEAAPKIVSVLLGHRTLDAGKGYTSICVETAAQRKWQDVRQTYAAGPTAKRQKKQGGADA